MRYIKIIELKRYSRSELLNKINNIKHVEDFFNTLIEKEILRIDRSSNVVLYYFDYVGVINVHKTTLLSLPKFYDSGVVDEKNFVRSLMRMLKKYREENNFFSNFTKDNSIIDSYLSIVIRILDYFLDYGLYKNVREDCDINGLGQILWNKTISESNMFISQDVPLYLEFYTNNIVDNTSSIVTEIHKSIIFNILLLNKSVLSILGYDDLNIEGTDLDSIGSKNYILEQLSVERSRTFSDHNKDILDCLILFIENNYLELTNKPILYGTKNMSYIWECMCRDVIGNNFNVVTEKPVWKFSKEFQIFSSGGLIPDILHLNVNNDIYIIDAKYYDFRIVNGTIKNYPGVQDIIKQHLYEISVKDALNEEGYKILGNLFIFPTTDDTECLGEVEFPPLIRSLSQEINKISIWKVSFMNIANKIMR